MARHRRNAPVKAPPSAEKTSTEDHPVYQFAKAWDAPSGNMNVMRLILALGWGVSMAAHGGSAFWVWNRNTPLSTSEKSDLQAAGVTTLYWHFAEIENRDGEWKWKKLPESPPEKSTSSLRVVPVIRLEASAKEPFETVSRAVLKQRVEAAMQSTGADEWQLDYDAPDRLIDGYADFLAELRPGAPKLSATALAGWVRLPSFAKLCGSVAELCPMFYDLDPDTATALRPLLDPNETMARTADWEKNCSIPWKAGLPWFSRLTIYGTDGKSHGHLRQWSWDDVVFRHELALTSPMKDGIAAFRAEKSFGLGRTLVREGEMLVARGPDSAALSRVENAVAHDVIYFRLPDAAASSGGSLRGFSQRGRTGDPVLTLTRRGDHLVLTNVGIRDLPARATGDGPLDRGYAVEVDAAGPLFREAVAGEFHRVAGHAEPDSEMPGRVGVAVATRLTFWFSALPAGESLSSGLFQLAPAAAASPLKYRILNLEKNPSWKPLDVSR